MAATILDGKALAKKLGEKLGAEVEALKAQNITPRIVSIQVMGDDASSYYVRNQAKQAEKIGVGFELVELPGDCTAEKLGETIQAHNANPETTGIILQVPLPKGLDGNVFQQMIAPNKDIEGIHAENLGILLRGGDEIVPCTARAAVEMLLDEGIEISGKHAVVLGRSAIVGKPLALMMTNRSATVTVCHSRTQNLAAECKRADIVLSAMGAKAGMVNADYIKEGAAVVDIAIISKPDGKGITGDVDRESVEPIAGYFAPVPGGVGPVTVMMLIRNTLMAARRQHGVK